MVAAVMVAAVMATEAVATAAAVATVTTADVWMGGDGGTCGFYRYNQSWLGSRAGAGRRRGRSAESE